jgi:hypothetical protein
MDSKHPKDVIILQHDELAYKPNRYPEYNQEYFDNIDICSLEYDLPLLKENNISFYPCDTTLSVGDTFVRSPYDKNLYINISALKDYIIQQKCTCLFDIARNLGAKEMKGSFTVEQVNSREWDISANVKCKLVKCDASVKREEEEKLNSKFIIESTSKGKSITIEDWKRAKKKAEQYNLISDPTVKNMLNALNPIENGGNHDLTQHISFSMSAETNKSLDIAFNLNSAVNIFKLSTDFHFATKYRYDTIVKIDFVFPE